jgi:hypothetical protein
VRVGDQTCLNHVRADISALQCKARMMCRLHNCHVRAKTLDSGAHGYKAFSTLPQTPIHTPSNYSPFLVEDSYTTRELDTISLFSRKHGADWSVAG